MSQNTKQLVVPVLLCIYVHARICMPVINIKFRTVCSPTPPSVIDQFQTQCTYSESPWEYPKGINIPNYISSTILSQLHITAAQAHVVLTSYTAPAHAH